MQRSTLIPLVRAILKLVMGRKFRPRLCHLLLLCSAQFRDSYLHLLMAGVEAEILRQESISNAMAIANWRRLSKAIRETFPEDPALRRRLLLSELRKMPRAKPRRTSKAR